MHRELVAVLGGPPDLVDVGEVDHRVDALAEQVQAERHQADIPGPLAVAEQAALDPVRPGQHRQLGVGNRGAPVVVGMHGQADVLAPGQLAAHPLDLVGVHIGRGALDGAGQVEDDLPAGPRLPDVHHRLAYLRGEIQLGVDEDLRRVLVAEVTVTQVGIRVLHHRPGALHRERHALRPVHAEHHPAEQRRCRVVHVHRGAGGADQRLHRPLDQLVPRLGQHGDLHVIGDEMAFDEAADEVEVRLARGREADLDLLVPHPYQQVEHGPLAGRAHRVDQRLVAVPQVRGQPARGSRDGPAGPAAVGQVNGLERDVALTGHPAGLLLHAGGAVLALHALGMMMILIGFHRRNCSLADRARGQRHARNPRQGSRPYRPPPRQISRRDPRSITHDPSRLNGSRAGCRHPGGAVDMARPLNPARRISPGE